MTKSEKNRDQTLKEIQPLAWKVLPGYSVTLYHQGFPPDWKRQLFLIRSLIPDKSSESGPWLKTGPLKNMIMGCMPDIVHMAPLSKTSDDSRWLTSLVPFTEEASRQLCTLLFLWLNSSVLSAESAGNGKNPPTPEDKRIARLLQETIDVETMDSPSRSRTLDLLGTLQSQQEVELIRSDNSQTVSEDSFTAIPLMVLDRLTGSNLENIHLNAAGNRTLISDPIRDPDTRQLVSWRFEFSLQTIPPREEPMLICHIRMARWSPGPDPEKAKGNIFLPYGVSAYVRIAPDRFFRLNLGYNRKQKIIRWDPAYRAFYDTWRNYWGVPALPPVEDLIQNTAYYQEAHRDNPQILLSYRNGIDNLGRSDLGVGVPMPDRTAIFHALQGFFADFAVPFPSASQVRVQVRGSTAITSRDDFPDSAAFRKAFCAATGHSKVTFELYALEGREDEQVILDAVEETIRKNFGSDTPDSCLQLTIRRLNSAKYISPLDVSNVEDGPRALERRSEELLMKLKKPDGFTACLFVLNPRFHPLHAKNGYEEKKDPKEALRNAFARSGRLVQFITPQESRKTEEEGTVKEGKASIQHRVSSAVRDLYRQCGLVTLLESVFKPGSRPDPILQVPAVGFHVFTLRIPSESGSSRKLRIIPIPLWVITNVLTGTVRVHCDLFDHKDVSYAEACLEMAKLYQRLVEKPDLDNGLSKFPAWSMLKSLPRRVPSKKKDVLVLVAADRTTRDLWCGLSNREIARSTADSPLGPHFPQKINTSTKKTSSSLSLSGTGIRIFRLRVNDEVPDYLTPLSKKPRKNAGEAVKDIYSSKAGLFRYGDLFWAIAPKPHDMRYDFALLDSRENNLRNDYAIKRMIELYPLQLQEGDDVNRWAGYVNALRKLSLQYNSIFSTTLPLPLHLAEKLEEYLFNPFRQFGQ